HTRLQGDWSSDVCSSDLTGRDEGATLVIQTQGKKGWFWYIPLHDDVLSVGVVAAYDYLFKDRGDKDYEQIYFEEVDRCPGLKVRDRKSTRLNSSHLVISY